MSIAASPPQTTDLHDTSSEAVDDEIARVRAENSVDKLSTVQALTQRRILLSSSLLSSTRVQARLLERQANPSRAEVIQDDLPLLLTSSNQIGESNTHRLALGVTAFPFTDPSPECQSFNPLLGIRFDVCDRTGRFPKQYHIFCRRASPSSQELRIHRHTIPSLVPLSDYENQYLQLTDEGYEGSDDSCLSNNDHPKTQDLHALVARVRKDLVSWRLRFDAIDFLRECLDLPPPKSRSGTGLGDEIDDEDENMSDDEFESWGKYGVRQLEICSPDASQARILWSDDRVGRIKLSSEGNIVKAAVVAGGTRLVDQERILSSGSTTIYSFHQTLERLHQTLQQRQ
ncbi:uncharacterized protein A1O9_06375 [Exophiala aquamarina CBS 119918]|uniref:Uncharacterized protein n=1 Tax=Exophiala aquamarina CBS 119918 TaxID=1182545 RepID=A0A072PEC3_9EURO|nr:uncharacterized protein A1O9_06375 [Exophiala aquamarina CBS 119918]KEF58449.1 hypothetical protein A1O9_06375 [Exophiala aquamarina CBS 119918]